MDEFGISFGFGDFGFGEASGLKNSSDHGKGESGGAVTENVLNGLPDYPSLTDIKSTLEAAAIMWFHEEDQNGLGPDSGQSSGLYDSSSNSNSGGDETMMLIRQMDSIEINDFYGFGESCTDNVLRCLCVDPFCTNLTCDLEATFSERFHENQSDLGSESDKLIGSNRTVFSSLNCHPCCICRSCKLNDPLAESASVLNRETTVSDACEPGEPHDGFKFVLPYLKLKDLIAVEGVCKILHDAVRNEPFYWKTICIDHPLSKRLTDDSLMRLTDRAQGNLQCLSLHECTEITDDGLLQVLARNPHLTKLNIEGCWKLTATGILSNVKFLKQNGMLGLKSIRMGGKTYFTKEQFKELNLLLGADGNAVPRSKVPRQIYGAGRRTSQMFLEDDQVTDLEICPRCEKPGLLYDCPSGTCHSGDQSSSPSVSCRGCRMCIGRCHGCGRCVNDCEFEELFCLDLLCFACCKKTLDQFVEDKTAASSSSSVSTPIQHELAMYQFCFYG